MANYSIPTPKSPFVDAGTGLVSREWFLYLNNLFGSVSTLTGSSVTATSGPLSTNQLVIADAPSDIASLTGLTASSVVTATSSGAIGTPVGLGTSTTVLHGNATSIPFYAAISLASDVSGILPAANGGTNASTALTNGQVLIGSTGAGPVASTITASTGLKITNAAGSITLAVSSAPQTSTITSGVGTFTTAAGALYLVLEMIAGGGGGGGCGTAGGSAGSNGTDTTFGAFTAGKGFGGGEGTAVTQGSAGAGGTNGGSPNVDISGASGAAQTAALFNGAKGAASYFGDGGQWATASSAGNSATPKGAGGGGAGGQSGIVNGGGGGGAAGYLRTLITSPATSFSFSTGTGGPGGTAGTSGFKGGDGANGIIVINTFFQ